MNVNDFIEALEPTGMFSDACPVCSCTEDEWAEDCGCTSTDCGCWEDNQRP